MDRQEEDYLKLHVGNIPIWNNPSHWDTFLEILDSLVSEDVKTYAEGFSDGMDEAGYRERNKETDNEITQRVIDEFIETEYTSSFNLKEAVTGVVLQNFRNWLDKDKE